MIIITDTQIWGLTKHAEFYRVLSAYLPVRSASKASHTQDIGWMENPQNASTSQSYFRFLHFLGADKEVNMTEDP